MIILLSPAKKIVDSRRFSNSTHTAIAFPGEAAQLVSVLKRFTPEDLMRLMKINPQLAHLTYQRFRNWDYPFGEEAVHALAAFDGAVYTGLMASTLSADELEFAQQHIRILSGLYGVLRPFDAIMPYRLEMGLSLQVGQYKHLYAFWGKKLARTIEMELKGKQGTVVVNLASEEYSKVVLPHLGDKIRVITPVFKEFKNGKSVIVAVFAKRARGLMSRFVIENRLSDPEHLKVFDAEGYLFEPSMSGESRFTFIRNAT